MLIQHYNAISHTCCKADGGLENSVHFCVNDSITNPIFLANL